MISPVKIQENINGALQDLITISDIIETGDNANGYYLRFTDGTQVCYYLKTLVGYTIPIGVLQLGAWVYPAAFCDSNISACITFDGAHTTTVRATMEFVTATGIDNLHLYSQYGSSFVMQRGGVMCIAVGRWK